MEMRAVPTFGDTINFKPAQDDFSAVADEALTVNITHVECAILQVDANGLYQTAEGSTDADFASFASLSGSLDDAYKIGDTINTFGGQGDVIIAGTEKLSVTASGGVSITNGLSTGGLANLNGGIAVDNTAFTVADPSGNVATAGSLDVAGLASLDGGIDVDGAFTVADTSGNVVTSGTLQAASAKVDDLTAGRVVLAGTAGEIEDSGNLTFDGSRLGVTGDLLVDTLKIDAGSITDSSGAIDFDNENLSTTGSLAAGSAAIADLTDGRVVLAGTAGELEDDANLTFNGSILAITGAVDASGSVAAGTMTIDSGSILDSSGAISFGDENLSTTGTLASGAATLASAKVSDLTDNEIVLAGAQGELEGDANFRFDGTNFDIGAAGSEKFRVVVASGNTTIEGNAEVKGNAEANGNLRVGASGANNFTVDAANGNVAAQGTL
ncbi:MAG: hypothetical protein ACO23O_15280, partial [Ilumatobacteraceae bacterium]